MYKRKRYFEQSASRRPLRVCIVTSTVEKLGGHAVQAGRLLEGLSREPGVRVDLLPINPRLPGPLRLLQRVKYVRTLVTWPAYVLSLLLRLPGYDVVHVFAASYLSFLLTPTPAVLIAKLFGKPVVLNYRSGEAEDHLARWRRTAVPTIRLANRVIAPSGYLVDVFARFNIEASAIFNIVDTSRFRFRERTRLRPVFFSNRNLEALYNVECTLRAFAIIQQRFPEASLIVAGDGGERERLEELSRRLALRNVEFTGRVSPEKMHELYAAADIYLNTPNIDNMPASILEAFASGVAVVTTDAGGIPYIVADGETGMLCPRGDYRQLAARAIRLLEDAGLASRIIDRARGESSKYVWAAVRDKWINLYNELAQEGAGIRREPAIGAGSPARERR